MPFCMECGTEMYEQLASDPTQPFDHVDMISIFVQLSHMNLNISLHGGTHITVVQGGEKSCIAI